MAAMIANERRLPIRRAGRELVVRNVSRRRPPQWAVSFIPSHPSQAGLSHLVIGSISPNRQFSFLPGISRQLVFLGLLFVCLCEARTSFEPLKKVLHQIFAI